MKRILLAILMVCLIALPVMAVNTTLVGSSKTVIQITGLDADWIWEDDLAAAGAKVLRGKIKRIVFYPSAASDRLILHDGGIDAAAYFDSGLVSGADDPRTVHYDIPTSVRLVMDVSDCVFSTAANAKILIYLEN